MNPNHDPSNGQFTFGPGGGQEGNNYKNSIDTSTPGKGNNISAEEQRAELFRQIVPKVNKLIESSRNIKGKLPPVVVNSQVTIVPPKYNDYPDTLFALPEEMDRTSDAINTRSGDHKNSYAETKKWNHPSDMTNPNDQKQCVAGVKTMTGREKAGETQNWGLAKRISDDNINTIPYGAVIATFKGDGAYGKYGESKRQHAAVVVGYAIHGGKIGLWVIDQYKGDEEGEGNLDGRTDYRFIPLKKLKSDGYGMVRLKN